MAPGSGPPECWCAAHQPIKVPVSRIAPRPPRNPVVRRAPPPSGRSTVPVVTLLNQKGGVGKTSCTHHLAGTLAIVFGKRVLIVDTDPQSSLTQGWWGPSTSRQLDPAVTITSVLRGD